MKPQTLFAALTEIAAEHEAHSADHLLVIPTITDDMETRRDLVAEVAEVLGGVLLDAINGGYEGPVRAYDDPVLRGDVQQSLTFEHAQGGGRTETELVFDGEHVDVHLHVRGRKVTIPSPSEARLMGVARALFDIRLVEAELAILLYDEKTLDGDTQLALLSMLAGLGRKPDVRLGGVRTLVPLMHATSLERERHCQPRRGVRFSLIGSELVRRNPTDHMDLTIRRVTAEREQPLVLFLGAGFSASSGMPVGNSVRNSAIRRILEMPDEDDGLTDEELARMLWEHVNRPPTYDLLSPLEKHHGEDVFARNATLEQVARIEAELLDVGVPPSIRELQEHHDRRVEDASYVFGDAIYALHRIIDSGRRLVIVTVNFDELVEYGHADQLDIAVDDDEFERLAEILAEMRGGGDHPDGKVPLLKLHGTISRPETCVVTDRQTRSGITPAKDRALRALIEDLPVDARAPWVYVGASMRDIDLDVVFSAHEFNSSGVNERWVAPWPEESVRRFVETKNRWWAARESLLSHTVTETADAFMTALADQW